MRGRQLRLDDRSRVGTQQREQEREHLLGISVVEEATPKQRAERGDLHAKIRIAGAPNFGRVQNPACEGSRTVSAPAIRWELPSFARAGDLGSMPNHARLVPLLVVRAAARALDFYVHAFGARLVVRYDDPLTGAISHADLAIEDTSFSLTEEAPAWSCDAPPSLGGSPVVLQLSVDDAEASLGRARAAGASTVFPLRDFCGERMARVRDPYGHHWLLRQRGEELTTEEVRRRRHAFASHARANRTSQTAGSLSTDPAFQDAGELARRIRAKDLGCVELARHLVERIERLDDRVGAVVVRDFERALDDARRADEALARGEVRGPLHGVPMTVKEAFAVAGLATTWGAPSFAGNVAAADAAVVARLRASGAVVLGKTNVPFMLGDFQTANELFGRTRNPFDAACTPGGSSGGSAAALAAGFTPLEVGSDIGGSIRNPAHYCGVYGHKPTFGIVPSRGHEVPGVPPAPDMAVHGPMARSAGDLALALDVLAGAESAGWRLELPPPRSASLRGLRVALWPTDPLAPVDDEIAQRVQELADRLARAGAVVSDVARPAFDPTLYRSTYVQLVQAVMSAVSSDAAVEVIDHRAWLRHDMERARLRAAWRRFFEDWDVLVCPIMTTTAFPHDERPPMERTVIVNGREQPYFAQVFWASLATLAYLPATAFPIGLSRRGMPIGLQVIGAEMNDRTTIEFARLVAQELGGFVPPPGFG